MKRIFIGSFILTLIVLATIFVLIKTKYYRNYNSIMSKISNYINHNDNNFFLTSKNCNAKNIDIYWKGASPIKTKVIEQGIVINNIENVYGDNVFYIFYRDKVIDTTGLFKYANWFTHDYYFNIQEFEKLFIVKLKIIGPDGYTVIDSIDTSNGYNKTTNMYSSSSSDCN